MTFQSINLGAAPNDGTGDDLRTAGGKINSNFETLFNRIDLATAETAGLMSPEDKARLDKALIEIALATTEAAGLMSPVDKEKLDTALTEVALATAEVAGLMSPDDKQRLDAALTSVSLATTEAAGLMSPEDKARLDSALTEVTGKDLTTKVAPEVADELVIFDSAEGQTAKLVPAGAFAMALLSRNAQSGASYTLTAEDAGRGVTMAHDEANTVIIPAGDGLPVGVVVNIVQAGEGTTTVTGDENVTINGKAAISLAVSTRWQGVSLWKIGADEWIASGALV